MRSRYSCTYIHFILTVCGVWLLFCQDARAAAIGIRLGERLSQPGYGYRDGAIESALFRRPQALRQVDGQLLIVDSGNHCLRQFDPTTRQVTTLAGRCETKGRLPGATAAARDFLFNTPTDLASTSEGLFILDSGNARVVRLQGDTATALEWPSLNPPLRAPYAISSDAQNRLYVSDAGYHGIARLDLSANTARWIAGVGTAGYDPSRIDAAQSPMRRPAGLLHYDAGGQDTLFVADSGNNLIRLLVANEDDTYTLRPYAGADEARNARNGYGAAPRLAMTRPYRLSDCTLARGSGWVLLVTLPTKNQVATLTLDHGGLIDERAFTTAEPAPETLTCTTDGTLYGLRPDGVLASYSIFEN